MREQTGGEQEGDAPGRRNSKACLSGFFSSRDPLALKGGRVLPSVSREGAPHRRVLPAASGKGGVTCFCHCSASFRLKYSMHQ